MLIKFIHCLATATDPRNPGDVVEVDDAEAGRLIAAGIAEAKQPKTATGRKGARATETATTADPVVETATVPAAASEVAITINPVVETATATAAKPTT